MAQSAVNDVITSHSADDDDSTNTTSGSTETESSDESKRQSPDQQALGEIVQEETLGGRKPLSNEDADTVLDWADELGVEGARDDRGKDHWEGGGTYTYSWNGN